MTLKAFDRYNDQWIYIILGNDDEMYHSEKYTNSDGVFHNQSIQFQAVEGDKDGCSPKRWSDLEQFTIVE